MGRISKMLDEVRLWDGAKAIVRPLNYSQREEADRERVRKAIEVAKGIDVSALLGGAEGREAAEAAKADTASSELDLAVCVRYGLVSYDGEEASDELVADLDAMSFEQIGRRIVELSTLDSAPLSAGPPAGTEAETTSQ